MSVEDQPIRVVVLGDTRERHNEVTVPPGDILIHTGDFSLLGRNLNAVVDFNAWLGRLPHKHKIVVYGDQELPLDSDPSMRGIIRNARVLLNQFVEIEGLRIWGAAAAPLYSPSSADANHRQRLFEKIPPAIDILITHGPPLGILDCPPGEMVHAGHPEVLEAAKRAQPCFHLFGHVQGAYGTRKIRRTTFVNACLCEPGGVLSQEPVVLALPPHLKR